MLNAQPGPQLNDPEQSFERPREIVEAVDLTRGMKVFALERWKAIVLQRITACQKARGRKEQAQRDHALLEEIALAKRSLVRMVISRSGAAPGFNATVVNERLDGRGLQSD
jgi:hypothetical protein